MKSISSKSDNALRTISEAALELAVSAHVLRFWETKFSNIKPVKYNNRRYYNTENLILLKKIKELLYEQNYSISEAIMHFKTNKTSSQNMSLREVPLFPNELTKKTSNAINLANDNETLIKTRDRLITAKNKLNALL